MQKNLCSELLCLLNLLKNIIEGLVSEQIKSKQNDRACATRICLC